MIRRWRRLDEPGLELCRLVPTDDGLRVTSSLVHAGAEPFGLHYRWFVDRDWRTRSLYLDLEAGTRRSLAIERQGAGRWLVDGVLRADLDGCDEPDLSATPFCNTLAIRLMAGRTGELTTAYVAAPELTVTPSRQRYEAIGPGRWRYVDLGVAKGFEAVIAIDGDGLVSGYEGLFEALPER
ncbi:MAG: putative glycolipid-binding domain-containing protein [Rhizobiales bacterium]|nr:putative glycolipid-binding domain-containing protein [Hyphomicrobiales bacterium]